MPVGHAPIRSLTCQTIGIPYRTRWRTILLKSIMLWNVNGPKPVGSKKPGFHRAFCCYMGEPALTAEAPWPERLRHHVHVHHHGRGRVPCLNNRPCPPMLCQRSSLPLPREHRCPWSRQRQRCPVPCRRRMPYLPMPWPLRSSNRPLVRQRHQEMQVPREWRPPLGPELRLRSWPCGSSFPFSPAPVRIRYP